MAVDDVRMVMMGVTQWLEEGEGNNKEMTRGNHAECFTNTNVQKQIQIQKLVRVFPPLQ